jgi:hypothetical protein
MSQRKPMLLRKIVAFAALPALVFAIAACPAAAQLAPSPADGLARIRSAAAASAAAEACTVEATSPCAQANPKIIAGAQKSAALGENLRALVNDIGRRVTGSPEMDRAVAWAVAAFKAAGADDVHAENFAVPSEWPQVPHHAGYLAPSGGQNVIAEIHGRENSGQFVILAAHLDSWNVGSGALDAGANAALVIEAAHQIHLTGLRPRRSIRFILFTGAEQGKLGTWAYLREHRAELDRLVAAIVFDGGAGRTNGFALGGRNELALGVRETLKDLDSSWGLTDYTAAVPADSDALDFLLEGVPTVLAGQDDAGYAANRHTAADAYDKVDLAALQRNTAVAGVLAFGLAEREMPIGFRLSRAATESLLESDGLADAMHQSGLWTLWATHARGRLP